MDKHQWHFSTALEFGGGLLYLFIYLRATVEKFSLAKEELQLDFPLANCNMEYWEFGLSFANNTM